MAGPWIYNAAAFRPYQDFYDFVFCKISYETRRGFEYSENNHQMRIADSAILRINRDSTELIQYDLYFGSLLCVDVFGRTELQIHPEYAFDCRSARRCSAFHCSSAESAFFERLPAEAYFILVRAG